MATVGASRGPRTAAFYIIAPRRAPMEVPGANEKSSSGGTNRKRPGPVWMFPILTCTKTPDYKPPRGAEGDAAIPGDKPFIMHPDGFGWIWVASGLKDGPLPAHYEPLESPLPNQVYPGQLTDPGAKKLESAENPYAKSPGRAISLRVDYLPADGTSHGGRNVALPCAPCGASAGAFLRAFSRPWHSNWHRAWWVGYGGDSSWIDRSARDGHRSREAGHRRRAHAASGRASVSLGLQRPGERGRGERPHRDFAGAECAHHGNESAALQCCSRAARARGGRCRRVARVHGCGATQPIGERHDHHGVSRPIPLCASDAKPAKSRARNGTASPTTASTGPGPLLRQHAARSGIPLGAT